MTAGKTGSKSSAKHEKEHEKPEAAVVAFAKRPSDADLEMLAQDLAASPGANDPGEPAYVSARLAQQLVSELQRARAEAKEVKAAPAPAPPAPAPQPGVRMCPQCGHMSKG